MYKANVKNARSEEFQLSYSLYMITASLFKSAIVKNPIFEKRLFLYYCELSAPAQIRLEEKVIRLVEGRLAESLKNMGLNPAVMNSYVSFQDQGEKLSLTFSSNRFRLTFHTERDSSGFLFLDVKAVNYYTDEKAVLSLPLWKSGKSGH